MTQVRAEPCRHPRRDDLAAEFRLRRLTQRVVADRCYITRQHLVDVLAGRRRLTMRLAREISMRTGIPLAKVLGHGQPAADS